MLVLELELKFSVEEKAPVVSIDDENCASEEFVVSIEEICVLEEFAVSVEEICVLEELAVSVVEICVFEEFSVSFEENCGFEIELLNVLKFSVVWGTVVVEEDEEEDEVEVVDGRKEAEVLEEDEVAGLVVDAGIVSAVKESAVEKLFEGNIAKDKIFCS